MAVLIRRGGFMSSSPPEQNSPSMRFAWMLLALQIILLPIAFLAPMGPIVRSVLLTILPVLFLLAFVIWSAFKSGAGLGNTLKMSHSLVAAASSVSNVLSLVCARELTVW